MNISSIYQSSISNIDQPMALPPAMPVLSIPARMGASAQFSGKNTCIAVIDSGFFAHPDLLQPKNRIRCYYDAVIQKESPLPPTTVEFYSWHGTMTACTAAGNGFLSKHLYSSLAPDAEVVLIRTMNSQGKIPTTSITHALSWCYKNIERLGIQIINLSVYADEMDSSASHPVVALVEKLVARGVIVVAASGNDMNAPLRPPATAPSVITVGGLHETHTLASDNRHLSPRLLNTSEIKPEVVAPAIWLPAPILPETSTFQEVSALYALDIMTDEMLLRTLPLMITETQLSLDLLRSHDARTIRDHIAARLLSRKIISPYYKQVDGTAFAAPIVCSIIAQMLEARPDLSPADVKQILIETAAPLEHYPVERQGYGMVQALGALAATLALEEELVY